jgi:hypothetical protein
VQRLVWLRTYSPECLTEAEFLRQIVVHGLILSEAAQLAGGGQPAHAYTAAEMARIILPHVLVLLQLVISERALTSIPSGSIGRIATAVGPSAPDPSPLQIDPQVATDLAALGSSLL